MTLRTSVLCHFGALACTTAAAHADLNILDTTFAPADWTTSKFSDSTMNADAFVTAAQVNPGGTHGAYRQIRHDWTPGFFGGPSQSGPGAMFAHLRAGATWNPATDGPITSISFSLDAGCFEAPYPYGPRYGLVALQNGVYYTAAEMGMSVISGWVPSSNWTLSQNDFRLYGTSFDRPDFSSSGAPIQFGFWTWGGGLGFAPSLYTVVGVDNFNLTIVPAPAATSVLALGTLLTRRRRR